MRIEGLEAQPEHLPQEPDALRAHEHTMPIHLELPNGRELGERPLELRLDPIEIEGMRIEMPAIEIEVPAAPAEPATPAAPAAPAEPAKVRLRRTRA